jgi:hypothetical protein
MTNYNCDICNFITNNKSNYTKHLHTKTHIENITPENKFCCDICLKLFSHKSSLCKHKKLCDKKSLNNDNINNINNNIVTNKDPTTTILLLQQEIKFLKEKTEIESKLIKEKAEIESKLIKEKTEIESKLIKEKTENKLLQKQSKKERKLLNEHKKELLKSKDEQIDLVQHKSMESVRNAYSEGRMNALTFVSLTYNKTPKMPSIPIESDYVVADVKSDKEIKYWIQQRPDFADEYIAERLLHIYDSKGFANYITNIIVKAYKKDDPSEQTFWASDVSRLIYIVRSTFDEKDEWVYDKKGVMIKESIIDPLLDEVYNIIIKYYKYMQKKYLHSTIKEESDYYMGKLPILAVAENLIKDFKNRQSIKNQVIRVLAPKFFLDRDLNKGKLIKNKPTIKDIEYEPPKLENDTIFDKIKNKKLEESKQIEESSEDTEEFLNDPRVKYKMEMQNKKESLNISSKNKSKNKKN